MRIFLGLALLLAGCGDPGRAERQFIGDLYSDAAKTFRGADLLPERSAPPLAAWLRLQATLARLPALADRCTPARDYLWDAPPATIHYGYPADIRWADGRVRVWDRLAFAVSCRGPRCRLDDIFLARPDGWTSLAQHIGRRCPGPPSLFPTEKP